MRRLPAVIAICLVFGPNAVHAAAAPEQPAQGALPSRPAAASTTPAPQRKTAVGDRCTTQYTNCILSDGQPLGSSCWCVTPFGPAYGRVVRGWN